MSIQSSLNVTIQTPFKRGSFKSDGGTYAQDAAETIAVAKYTVLGKITLAAGAITPGTNTGDGTVTAFSLTGNAIVGDYSLVLTAALVADLYDPNGNIIAKGIALTDGDATVVVAGGIQFTVTDGAVAFVADDSFAITVDEGSGKLKALESDAVDGSQYPVGIINESILAASIVAGDVEVLDYVVGGDGIVDKNAVVFHNGSDTLATVVNGKTIESYFNDKGLFFKEITDFEEYENA